MLLISLLLVNHHTMSVGPDQTLSLFLLPISIWLLFAIFSLKVVLSSGCSIVVILVYLWEEVSFEYTDPAILTGNQSGASFIAQL